ncbi:MAG TPA: hypothetical protein VN207_00510 [Ktedonobacteraceae bacterium]|nr:hypothetical protein [Ktedonobacteraceae bacterium]
MLDKSTAVSDAPALPWGERDTTLEQIGRMGQDAVRWSLSHLLKEGGIVKIDRWYPSSKTCYNGKHVVEDLPLHLVC